MAKATTPGSFLLRVYNPVRTTLYLHAEVSRSSEPPDTTARRRCRPERCAGDAVRGASGMRSGWCARGVDERLPRRADPGWQVHLVPQPHQFASVDEVADVGEHDLVAGWDRPGPSEQCVDWVRTRTSERASQRCRPATRSAG